MFSINLHALINAFSWLAADLQMFLMCRLKFSLSSNCTPKSFIDGTTLIC